MPFVQDPRGMAGVVIAGTVLAFAVFGRKAFGTGAYEMVMVTLGVLTLGFAIAALIAGTVWALLVPAMAGLVLMWAWPSCTTPATSHASTLPGTGKPQQAAGPAKVGWPPLPGTRTPAVAWPRAGRAVR